jgi:histidinol-phosphate phosphatase family protein
MIVSYVDRDGVLIASAPHTQYVNAPEDVVVIPGVYEALSVLSQMGPVVVVSNQAGVAKGLLSHNDLFNITLEMLNQLPHNSISRIYYCTHDKDEKCSCRKPNTGLVNLARQELGIDTDCKEFFFGDFVSDMECAKRAGCIAVGIARPDNDHNPPPAALTQDVARMSDIYADSFYDAVSYIACHHTRVM